MTPVYLNPSSTSPFSPYNIHIVEQAIDEDQRLKLLNTSSTLPYQSFASSSLISFPTFFHSSDNQRRTYGSSNTTTFGDQALLYYQRADDKLVWHGEQICDQACTSETLVRPVVNVSSDEYTDKINLEDHVRNIDEPMKHWTSSDMRLKQKTNSFMDHQLPDHKFQSVHHDDFQHQENNIGQTTTSSLAVSNNNRSGSSTASGVRVCSDCSTSTTPLWRSGPRGPKTLCNACGIRQRKARRAMADAAAAANVSALCTNQTAIAASSMSKSKEKKSLGNHNVTERCNSNKRKIDTANTISLTCYKTTNNKHKAASPQSVLFPQDVAEAAMMLMELSSGLMIHS